MSSEEGKSFEEQWQDAFEDAKMQPPEHLWGNIDGVLANEAAVKLNKQVQFYRYVAAAAIILSFSLGIYLMAEKTYLLDDSEFANHENFDVEYTESVVELAVETEKNLGSTIEIGQNNFVASSSMDNNVSNSSESNIASESSRFTKINTSTTNQNSLVEVKNQASNSEYSNLANLKTDNVTLISNSEEQKWTAGIPTYEILNKEVNDPLIHYVEEVEMDGVAIYGVESIKNKKYLKESWASVEFGGGMFEPNYNTSSGGLESTFALSESPQNLLSDARYESANVQNNEDMTAGASYIMGMNYGAQVSKRIVIQSGLQYGVFESSSVTNTIFETSATTGYALTAQALRDPSLSRIVQEEDYQIRYENVELSNTFRMASVPVKAGLILVDRKLNIMLDGGIQANMFLGNEISDPDNKLQTVEIRPGASSPYRTFNFSAITGLTVGYNFLKNYAVTINPSYQRSINPLTKETSSFSTSPEGFGISVGVRYVLR